MDAKMCHSLHCSDGMDIARPVTLKVLQVFTKIVNEKPFTTSNFLNAHTIDRYCWEAAIIVGKPGCVYSNNWEGVVVRKLKIDSSVRNFVPESLPAQGLYMAHYLSLLVIKGWDYFYTLWCEFYWPDVANKAYKAVANGQLCAAQGTKNCHQNKLFLFPASRPLELVVIEILGPLTKKKYGNYHVVILTDRWNTLTRTIPVPIIASTNAATVFIDNWVIPYGI